MQISGFGDGGGGQRRQTRGERARAFRARHRVGERLSGELVEWVGDGLAWVEVDGQRLLARLQSRPGVGQVLHFLVVRLEPEIELRELRGSGGAGAQLMATLQEFWTVRNQLDSVLAQAFGTVGEADAMDPADWPELAARKAAYLAAVGQVPEALVLFTRLLEREEEVNAHLSLRGGAVFAFMPWLVPGARNQEVLFARREDATGGPVSELAVAFTLQGLGTMEARLLRAEKGVGEPASLRLHLERYGQREAIKAAARAFLEPLGRVSLVAASPLRPGYQGVLTGLLASVMGMGAGIDTRV